MITFKKKLDNVHEQIKQLSNDSFEKELHPSISNGLTGEKILEKSFNKIQGSDFQSNTEAANQSLKKMSEKITEDFLPGIIELIKEK